MAIPGAKDRASELEALILRHQELYYNGEPEISDEEFDALWEELKSIDPLNPILARVGADAQEGWPKASHLMPMGSQSKASSIQEFAEWAAKRGPGPFLVQYKLDGASLEVQYNRGRIQRAVTRGDGLTGDDITPNAVRMKGVLKTLPFPFTGAVRGEVLMSRETHGRTYADKANCRNAANGLMKRKDGVGSEDLDLICYDAKGWVEREDGSRDRPFSDELEKIEWLKEAGFAVVKTEVLADAEDVVAYRATTME
ncbi:MAG TPA: DNA ligase (NAD(+)) LigA, partial [Rectinemataceae bacterium]